MFRFNNQKIKFDVVDGMEVVVSAKVSLYVPSGSYQLIVNSMRVEGVGDLELAFNQLKEKLEKEGLFDLKYKKILPSFPKKVAIVTSITSAAYQDIIKTARHRYNLCSIHTYNSLMQGDEAANFIIQALKKADNNNYDAIIIARGGGSKEDLWCFNDERLAREVFAAKTPIISAIGHEIDYTILDFVSDHRSATPTASIIDLMPDKDGIIQWLDIKYIDYRNELLKKLENRTNRLKNLKSNFKNVAIGKKIELNLLNLKNSKQNFENLFKNKILKLENDLRTKELILEEKNQFFKITKNLVQIKKDGKIINLDCLKSGDEISLYSQNSSKKAVIK
ncbi:exodeoxyribonuclease VII, large subunit [Campylobacter blaseri]|nr:exodeoxyribonuclease VII, large subunit [Campylobacter blaseri]